MKSKVWPRALKSVLLLISIFMTGCSSFSGIQNPFTDWSNPFAGPEPTYKAQYGPTPAQKANRLRQLAQTAGTMSAEDQTRISTELYELYSKTSDPILRREAVKAMGAFPVSIAAAGLHAASEDAEPAVRMAACEAWQRRGGPEAVAALSALLQNDAHVDVRLAASTAITTFPVEVASLQLGKVLHDRDPAIQFAAMDALRTVTGEEMGNDASRWSQYVERFNTPDVSPPSNDPMIALPESDTTLR